MKFLRAIMCVIHFYYVGPIIDTFPYDAVFIICDAVTTIRILDN